MVTVIHSNSSLRNCINYNEKKVRAGCAKCLEAGYYPMEAGDMDPHQKLVRLQKLTTLNQRTKRNCVHISLNFDPSENLSEGILKEIAETYLEKIGFPGQPYLLYQHFDAEHPHVHIVTTNIKPDGKAIKLHDLGKGRSSAARKEIEAAYHLVRAEDTRQREMSRLRPVNQKIAIYGRIGVKWAIGAVLDSVLNNYLFTSFSELNAVLGLYNICADRGAVGSPIWEHQGLIYWVLDEANKKVGAPVKASGLFSRPTLKNIQKKFGPNEIAREPYKGRLRNTIDLALLRVRPDLPGLINALKKEGVDMLIRKDADDDPYSITYVDHVKRTVLAGKDLGLPYDAKGVLERCAKYVDGEVNSKAGQAERVGQRERAAEERGLIKVDLYNADKQERIMDAGSLVSEQVLRPAGSQMRHQKKKKQRQTLVAGRA